MSPLNITQPLDSIRYMVYNGYYKVMSSIPKMGHLTAPVKTQHTGQHLMTKHEERFPAQVSENMPDFTGYITGSKGHHIMVKGLIPKPYTKSLVNEC